MDYKEEFLDLLNDNRFEEARILLERNKQYANEDPFFYGNMGWLLVHMERYQEAEIYLLKGIHLFEDDGWMYSQLGFCYHRQGRIEDGIQALYKALDYGYEESWVYAEIGWGYKELGDYKQAVSVFEDCLMDDPNNAWVLSQAAACYAFLHRDEDALDYYLKSYRILPDSDACFDLANYYHEHKQYRDEIQYLKQIKDEESIVWKEFQLARAYLSLQEPNVALQHLLVAEKAGRDDTSFHSLMADTYMALHQVEEANDHYNRALQYYERALLLEKDHGWIYQEMIWIAHKQKDWNKKLSYLERASKEKKEDLWLTYHFARCYSDLHRYPEAIDACVQCMKLGEKGADILDLYAWNLGRNKQYEDAIDVLFERMQKTDADDWCYGELGSNYMQLQDYATAFEFFEKGSAMTQDPAYFQSMMGMCQFQLQNYQKALEYFHEAEELGRKDSWLYTSMGETLTKLQRYCEADTYFDKAKEIESVSSVE